MKVSLLALVAALFLASCAQSLEGVADSNRQARIDAANANRPLSSGAGDGLGRSIAQNEPDEEAPKQSP